MQDLGDETATDFLEQRTPLPCTGCHLLGGGLLVKALRHQRGAMRQRP
jgi:hypothetical protein